MSQNETLFIVTGLSVDGREYFTAQGWQLNGYAHAALMTREDAEKVAACEEKRQAATRNPDTGIYRIAVMQWGGPSRYFFADYERDAREGDELERLYGESEYVAE